MPTEENYKLKWCLVIQDKTQVKMLENFCKKIQL